MREQTALFHNMRLGLLRLDAVLRLGLGKVFCMPEHVQESVRRELPVPSRGN